MNAQDTPPAWFNLDAVIEPEAQAELHRLADEVERVTADFDRLAERCFRALTAHEKAANGMEVPGADAYEVLRSWSGAGRLHDALYALAGSIDAARMERPDTDPAWWVRVRAELGLNEWGVSVSNDSPGAER